MKYIIEHSEPELWDWCLLEYKHISSIVGKKNLIFTNVKNPSKLKNLGKVYKKSVLNLKLNKKKTIILDPSAKKKLSAKDNKDSYLIFGGILGDFPRKARTKEFLTSKIKCKSRNLGKYQFSTDSAVLVAKLILEGKKFKVKNKIEIPLGKYKSMEESVILPFAFPVLNGNVIITPGLKEHLKKRKEF